MAEKGWLKKQLVEAEQEIGRWPEWRRADIDEQYEELKQFSAAPQDNKNKDHSD